jgi:leader peptidase (prepilin peptidase)/N-methyltransferase
MTIELAFLFTVLFILMIFDVGYFWIPNCVIIPAIIITCLVFEHYYLWGFILFAITFIEWKLKFTGGGDVKLFTLIGLILGIKALIVLFAAHYLVRVFRKYYNKNDPIPLTPFVSVASVISIFL